MLPGGFIPSGRCLHAVNGLNLQVVTGRRVLRTFGSGFLVVVLAAAALSGCGSNDDSGSNDGTTTSGESSSLDGWAQGLCTSVAAWQGSIKETSKKMANSQADFASASEAITSANNALIEGLKGLGTPPAPATTEAKHAIDELTADLENEAGEIEQALFGVSTQSEIVTASSQVRASISKMDSDIANTVTELKALPDEQGWKQAFQQVAACQTVAKG
jgi:hypothetical protein